MENFKWFLYIKVVIVYTYKIFHFFTFIIIIIIIIIIFNVHLWAAHLHFQWTFSLGRRRNHARPGQRKFSCPRRESNSRPSKSHHSRETNKKIVARILSYEPAFDTKIAENLGYVSSSYFNGFKRSRFVICDWWISIRFVCFCVLRFVACDCNYDWRQRKTFG